MLPQQILYIRIYVNNFPRILEFGLFWCISVTLHAQVTAYCRLVCSVVCRSGIGAIWRPSIDKQVPASCSCVGSTGLTCGTTVEYVLIEYSLLMRSTKDYCMSYCLQANHTCCGCNFAPGVTMDANVACFGCPSGTNVCIEAIPR